MEKLVKEIKEEIHNNTHEGFETELVLKSGNYFVSELNVDFTTRHEQGDEDCNYHSHTIRENLTLHSIEVVCTDFGKEDERQPKIEAQIIELFNK